MGSWVRPSGPGVGKLTTVGAGPDVETTSGVTEVAQDTANTAISGQLHQKRKVLLRNPDIDFHHAELPPATTSAAI